MYGLCLRSLSPAEFFGGRTLRAEKGFVTHVDSLLHVRNGGAEPQRRAVLVYLVGGRDKEET